MVSLYLTSEEIAVCHVAAPPCIPVGSGHWEDLTALWPASWPLGQSEAFHTLLGPWNVCSAYHFPH